MESFPLKAMIFVGPLLSHFVVIVFWLMDPITDSQRWIWRGHHQRLTKTSGSAESWGVLCFCLLEKFQSSKMVNCCLSWVQQLGYFRL